MKANPFVITFADGADGGPVHMLHLLVGFAVEFYRQGELINSGVITRVCEVNGDEFVFIQQWCEQCGDYCGGEYGVSVYHTFDEVRYL